MSSIDTARSLLPIWVQWGNLLICVPAAFLISLVCTLVGMKVALGPIGRLRGLNWVDCARQSYPARLAVTLCGVFLPIIFGFLALDHAGPLAQTPVNVLVLLVVLAAYAGMLVVRIGLNRRLFEKVPSARYYLRSYLAWWVIMPQWIFIALLIFLPTRFNGTAILMLASAAFAFVLVNMGASLALARRLGLAWPAPPHLQSIVDQLAERIGVHPRGVDVFPSPSANAWAFPLAKRLAFTERAEALLSDEELTPICAHELAHLAEPFRLGIVRALPSFMLLALTSSKCFLGLNPDAATTGSLWAVTGSLCLMAVLLVTVMLVRRIGHRMEKRADAFGSSHETDAGAYGRALEKLYQLNLVPPVTMAKKASHPHLYDRLVAAGVEPSYPRPKRPSRGRMFAGLAVAIALALAVVAGSWTERHSWRRHHKNERAYLWLMSLDGGQAMDLMDLSRIRYRRGDKEDAFALQDAAAQLLLDEYRSGRRSWDE
jgi:Zn-dependent protease with chaperone function